jgi:hypothetical protein
MCSDQRSRRRRDAYAWFVRLTNPSQYNVQPYLAPLHFRAVLRPKLLANSSEARDDRLKPHACSRKIGTNIYFVAKPTKANAIVITSQ